MGNLERVLPSFPYGAVYYRKSNPPAEDWERDYATASADGMNIFRHWFLWNAVELSPREYAWEDYDTQLDLAERHGMKTIIAEMTVAAPEWAYRRFPHARSVTAEGRVLDGTMSAGCATGGFGGMCLDNDDFRSEAERWLTTLVKRYRGHAGLGGYDIWNECNIRPAVCYCEGTQKRFRQWLKRRYSDPRAVGRRWQRHSFSDWEDITPPRELGPYPDTLDWLQFRIDNAYELMQWRADLIRKADPDAVIVAHGIAASLSGMAPSCADDWLAAGKVDVYGCTWGSSRHGDEPWKQFHAMDLVRSSSRGKPFWHAEAYAGPLWMQPQVIGKPRNEGRIASPEDIRYWDLVSFMCGARGLMYLRWRPLLNGPLFGAFGAYGMDGSRTDRSRAAAEVATWVHASEQKQLWASQPVRGDVGILYVPETQLFLYAQQHSTAFYTQSAQGAYRGFFDNNVQADWVHINHIDEYDFLYLPIPVMLSEATATRLTEWVRSGGTLFSEGCPAYFGDNGTVGTVQPNYKLDELFGARESYVEFTPDLLDDTTLSVNGAAARGGVFMQTYEPSTGEAAGYYADGRTAAVSNRFGKGRTLLVGTMIGYGYSRDPGPELSRLFRDLLAFAGKSPAVSTSPPGIAARLCAGDGGRFLWLANPARRDASVRVHVDKRHGDFSEVSVLRGGAHNAAESAGENHVVRREKDGAITITVRGRDVAVLELK